MENNEIACTANVIRLINAGDEEAAADMFFDMCNDDLTQADVDAIMHVARREDPTECAVAAEIRNIIRDNTDLTV